MRRDIKFYVSITVFGYRIPIWAYIDIEDSTVKRITETVLRVMRRFKTEDDERKERKERVSREPWARTIYKEWGLSTMMRNCLMRQLIMPNEVMEYDNEKLQSITGIGAKGAQEIIEKRKRIED